MFWRGILTATICLLFATPTAAQVCTGGPIGFDFGVGTEDAPRNCVNLFWCYPPEPGGVEYRLLPGGCDPTQGGCTVRAVVPLRFPGNRNNSTAIGFLDSPAKLLWQDSGGGFVGSCGNFGGRIQVDEGEAWIERTFACGDTGGGQVYDLQITVCDGISGCQQDASVSVDLTDTAVSAAVCPGPPPEEDCDSCASCFGFGGGFGAGGPGGEGGGGAPGAGGGGVAGGEGTGPGAHLRYKAGSLGRAGLPAPADWPLGRNWSHSYAAQILEDAATGEALLFTASAVYKTFRDTNLDGLYDEAAPGDEYRTLEKTASGFILTDLGGTINTFDTSGRWQSRTDRNGNTLTATYTGNQLTSVAFPDGRREDFAYHLSGHLDTLTEVGVDSTTMRQWSYTWSGDDLTRVDRPDGTAFLYLYDDPALPGYITRITLLGSDGTSERITAAWEYDAQGNVVKLWRGADLFENGVDGWQLAFDDPLLPTVTTVTDPLGNVSTYTWATRTHRGEKARLVRIEGDCPTCGLGPNSQLSYDDVANPYRVTEEIDGRGHLTRFAYDLNGRRTSRIEAFGTALERETTWTYHATWPALVETITRPSVEGFPNEEITTFGHDTSGNVTSRIDEGFEDGAPFSYTTTMVPNAGGSTTSMDPPGYGTADVVTFAYDATRGNGLLVQESRTDPLIGTTAFDYDPFNRRTSITDVNGVLTETEYDSLDRVHFVRQRGATVAEDLVTEYRYNTFGDPFQRIYPEGNVVEYSYDAAGRLVFMERKADNQPGTHGERVIYTLDAIGNRILEEHQSWDGAAWRTRSQTASEYSTRCHLDRRIQGSGAEESVTEFAYDCSGNLERTWDANHPSAGQTQPASSEYFYDELDRLTAVHQPFGGAGGGTVVTSYTYDVQDHLASVTDAEGTVTNYEYSDRDLLTQETSEISGVTTFEYNDHGQLTSRTDARGITMTRTVDVLDRVTFEAYPGTTLDVATTYDDPAVPFSLGRLTRIERDGHGIHYGYDRFGRLTQDGVLSYGYDDNGNRREIVYPGGAMATYAHDFADRPASLDLEIPSVGTVPLVSGATYEPSGPLNSLTLGNGLVESRGYDSRYFPNSIELAGAQTLLDWQYSTDSVGNITGITDGLSAASSRTYGYQDYQYFLIQGDGPWGTRGWTYDPVGNRLSATRDGVSDTYTYVPNTVGGRSAQLDQITLGGGGTQTFSFDAAGNQTTMNDSGDLTERTYDDAGRLSSESRASTGSSSAFLYDGRSFLRRSTGAVPDVSGDAIFCDGFESGDLAGWDNSGSGNCLVRTTTEPNYDTRGLLHGLDDGTLVVYFGSRPVAQVDAAGVVSFLITDHLGTPVVASDGTGAVVWEGGFEPFGEDWNGASSAGVFLRFPGQWVDGSWAKESGDILHYNVFRFYDPSTGTFLKKDPLGIVRGGINLYNYGLQAPQNLVDPLGLATCVLISGVEQLDLPGDQAWFFGDHAGMFFAGSCGNGSGDNGDGCAEGGPLLYDPNGGYPGQFPGSGDSYILDEYIEGWALSDYFDYQCRAGSDILEIFCFRTSCCEEQAIRERIGYGGSGAFGCSTNTTRALSTVGPFQDLGSGATPALLRKALNKTLRKQGNRGSMQTLKCPGN